MVSITRGFSERSYSIAKPEWITRPLSGHRPFGGKVVARVAAAKGPPGLRIAVSFTPPVDDFMAI